ncbi:hypothetical protein [Actinomadura sp. NPDC049753]|uniref:hypothetical protein n=1 Tax=Actinomadura sp. NPDC049753 TaxID=3154739 RepID=UPI0034155B69
MGSPRCLLVTGEAVIEDRDRALSVRDPVQLALGAGPLDRVGDQQGCFGLLALHRRQEELGVSNHGHTRRSGNGLGFGDERGRGGELADERGGGLVKVR